MTRVSFRSDRNVEEDQLTRQGLIRVKSPLLVFLSQQSQPNLSTSSVFDADLVEVSIKCVSIEASKSSSRVSTSILVDVGALNII